jgi:hypothetical protein
MEILSLPAVYGELQIGLNAVGFEVLIPVGSQNSVYRAITYGCVGFLSVPWRIGELGQNQVFFGLW